MEYNKFRKLPYLDVKVVKVEKGKPKYSNIIKIDGKKDTLSREDKNGNIYLHKEKGNWVNGENLDKIKFPVPCSYVYCGEKFYGIIDCSYTFFEGHRYTLSYIQEQGSTSVVIKAYSNLKELIEKYDIHILKGKIILFEEEK